MSGRLQNTIEDVKSLCCGQEDCPAAISSSSTKNESSAGEGDGRYDGEVEGGEHRFQVH